MESVRVSQLRSTRLVAQYLGRMGLVCFVLVFLLAPAGLRAATGQLGAAARVGWDSLKVIDPVVINDGGTFKMWYTGVGVDREARIGYATSDDGVVWTKYAQNPVLDLGPSGSWDQSWVRASAVIKQGTTYEMWYVSGGKVGYATSPDGVNWTKHANNPVLEAGSAGSWEETKLAHLTVSLEAGTYKMWYSGFRDGGDTAEIGYATSANGVDWVKDAVNPVLLVGSDGDFDHEWAFDPSVVNVGAGHTMWYSGCDNWSSPTLRIGLATSSDGVGVAWAKYASNPVLNVAAGEWDSESVTGPWVIYDGETYHMWYHGGIPGTTSLEEIGYATSDDGVTWTKYAGNPVLSPSDMPEQVFLPVVLRN